VPRYVENTFNTGNVVIPRNTQLMIDLVSLNKGPRFWSNPICCANKFLSCIIYTYYRKYTI